MTTTRTMRVRLEMQSDWHIGTGLGRPGSVDRLIDRDEDGLPFVPAKTLAGMWRDACERLTAGLDAGRAGPGVRWQEWVEVLFGSQPGQAREVAACPPRPAALRLHPARFPPALRRYLLASPSLIEAVTFTKPGVAIDPRTGAARGKFLRVEELARGGVTLEGACEITLAADDDQWMAALALLVVGAGLIERIGGKRRRGAGRCRVMLDGQEPDEHIRWLEARPDPPPPPGSDLEERPPAVPGGCRADGSWWRLDLVLITRTPVLIPASVTGNVLATADFVPGTYLLPLVTRTLASLGVDVRSAVAQGALRILHATPEVDGARGRPVPRALAYEKLGGGLDRGTGVYNLLRDLPPHAQVKPVKDGYVGPTSQGMLPAFVRLAKVTRTHNVVEDSVQRPTEAVGGVFSYEAIPAGTRLRSELWFRGSLGEALSQGDQTWWKRFEVPYRVGRSRKDDYGLVQLEVPRPPQVVTFDRVALGPGGELTVWLLSDALLRDDSLHPCASPEGLRRALEQALGARLSIMQSHPDGGTLAVAAYARRTESWHTSWGLPRPSLVGVGAGSCVSFRVDNLDPQRLDEVAQRVAEVAAYGIGERTAEGYGEVVFNDLLVTSPLAGWQRTVAGGATRRPRNAPRPTEGWEATYASLLETEVWRDAIRRTALAKASSAEWRRGVLGVEGDRPPLSQLAALRTVLGGLRSSEDVPTVLGWIERLEAVANRKAKWPTGALDRIRQLVNEPARVWRLLDLNPLLIDDAAAQERCRQQLWGEAVRAVVDACVRAHRRELEARSGLEVGVGRER